VATQFGYRLALIAFATATLRGALTGSDFEGTLHTALLAGAAFFVLGMICGELARRVVEEQVEAEFESLTTGTDGDGLGPLGDTQQQDVSSQ
jgi:hypothetical protein